MFSSKNRVAQRIVLSHQQILPEKGHQTDGLLPIYLCFTQSFRTTFLPYYPSNWTSFSLLNSSWSVPSLKAWAEALKVHVVSAGVFQVCNETLGRPGSIFSLDCVPGWFRLLNQGSKHLWVFWLRHSSQCLLSHQSHLHKPILTTLSIPTHLFLNYTYQANN